MSYSEHAYWGYSHPILSPANRVKVFFSMLDSGNKLLSVVINVPSLSSFMPKLSWPTVVKGDTKAPFSITTTLGRVLLLFLDCSTYLWFIPYSWVLSKEASSTIFLSLWSDSTWDWFGLVCFNGISTIVGYLKPNPIYIYILDI